MTETNGALEVQTLYPNPVVGLNPQDLAGLGAMLAGHGLTQLQVQGLMSQVHQVAAQTTVAMLPKVLEDIRKIQESRFMEIVTMIRAMQNMGGYVRADRVIQAIQMVASKNPSQ